MKKELDKKRNIVLYGAGLKAHSVYRALIISGYTIVYCVITDNSIKESEYEEIKVYPFADKKEEIIEKQYQIVIAVVPRYEAEIIEIIEDNGISEYWKPSQMPWSVDFEMYRNLDADGYMEVIKEKYYSDTEKYRKDKAVRDYIEENVKRTVNNKKITFLLLAFEPRSYKIIDALHRKGYFTEVIVWGNAVYVTEEKYHEYSEIADECRLCIDVKEVMLYCASTDSKILHIFSEQSSNIELPQVLINCKSIFPKTIFDEYDVVAEMYRFASQKLIDAELFCFEHTDGICSRYRCMEYLEEKGYSICQNRIYFIDCCNDFIGYESPQRREEEELHLVHVGTVLTDKAYETSRVARLLEFGLQCRENRVHLHIYPTSYDAAKLHKYIEMERMNPYFHLHHTVSMRVLAQEISKYDFGILNTCSDFLEYADREGTSTKEKHMFAEANRMYDFLDSGLPVVAAHPVEQVKMFEEDGVLIRKTDEEIDFDELRQKRNQMKKRVVQIRDKYRISNQLPVLIEFYDSL